MNDLIFVGTLHLGLTDMNELLGIINDFDPELILVEIVDDDIYKDDLSSYPVEMVGVLKYFKGLVDVRGFDVSLDVLNSDLSNEDIRRITNVQVDFIMNYSWIDFNKVSLVEKLDSLSENLFDKKNWDLRQKAMKENIDVLSKDKRCLVVCGASHIAFFRNEFERAKFL